MRPIDADDLLERLDSIAKISPINGIWLEPVIAFRDIRVLVQSTQTMGDDRFRVKERSEWLEDSDPGQEYGTTWACFKCGHSLHQPYIWNPYERNWRYCPWCGRKMEDVSVDD